MKHQYSFHSPALRQKIDELIQIGFLEPDCWNSRSAPENLLLLIQKIAPQKPLDTALVGGLSGPDCKPDSCGPLRPQEFYLVGLQLLGYRPGIDFEFADAVTFAASLGIPVIDADPFGNEELADAFYDLLITRGRNSLTLLDIAVGNGAFRDFNKGKAVPETLFFNGRALPVLDPSKCICERVYVECPQDTDQDGKRDLIAIYIRRPAETDQGLKVPAVYVANPYGMGCNEDTYHCHNVDKDLAVKPPSAPCYEDIRYRPRNAAVPEPRIPEGEADCSPAAIPELEALGSFTDYFLPRGYASVYAGGIGTRGSDGIRTCGSMDETISTIAVIEWLAGNRTAFTNKTDNIESKAWWCNGNVGMSGKSYLGTLAIAAACSGVRGLKTVIAESAICNWYSYYRENGLNSAALGWQGDDADQLAEYCMSRRQDLEDYGVVRSLFAARLVRMRDEQDRESANYNTFWDERNYLNLVHQTKASVYIVHGLNDWNVKPAQFDSYWRVLKQNGVNCKMILHQGGHIYINGLRSIDFYDIMGLWLAKELHGIDNRAGEVIPDLLIQENLDVSRWFACDTWPRRNTALRLYPGEDLALSPKPAQRATLSFVDSVADSGFDRERNNLQEWLDAFALDPASIRRDRLLFWGEALGKELPVSGTATVQISAALDRETGILSAMLVDYGKCRRMLSTTKAVGGSIPFAPGWNGETLVDFEEESLESLYRVITRGHINVQNKSGLLGADAIIPGEAYTFRFDLHPVDYTLAPGHRLGLILYGTDMEATQRPFVVTHFTVHLSGTFVELPVAAKGI